MRIILASKSPRRRMLLSEIVDDFEILTKETDETLPVGLPMDLAVTEIAVRKGRAIADDVGEEALVISSDTLVEIDGVPLGKPRDKEDAVRMLHLLSGKTHNVHTGVAVHYRGRLYKGVDTSFVTFRELSDQEILEYADGGEPLDKAGSYAIQGNGAKFVSGYTGDFNAIVGLGLSLTKTLMEEALKNDSK